MDIEQKALIYAEKYGIIDYKIENGIMIWKESYPNEGEFIHEKKL